MHTHCRACPALDDEAVMPTPRGRTALPAELERLSTSRPVAPPVETNLQVLPFADLGWKDFERLCLRLARTRSDVDECRLYGVQGDEQEGIDLYARVHETGAYRVYQCKCVQDFGPAKIVSAVDLFLSGDWRGRATEFYLCATDSFGTVQRTDAIREQGERLAALGMSFVAWDVDELCLELKSQPELVDDFFGRAWVRAFCGAEAAERMGERLDGVEAWQLRESLAKLYFEAFRQDDPTFDFRDPSAPPDRVPVLPDVFTEEAAIDSPDDEPVETRIDASSTWTLPFMLEDDADRVSLPLPPFLSMGPRRVPVTQWLTEHDSFLVVGGPGSGKSTLLRILALELLSTVPQLQDVSRRWGTFLPVWIPFAYWTALLTEGHDVSLLDALTKWMHLHGGEHLVPLIERALRTQRLLLVVDGFDEWENQQAARNAFAVLQTFSAHRKVPVIASCRPRAFAVLGRPRPEWSLARIALLSPTQQSAIARDVLRHELGNPGPDDDRLSQRTSQFLHDVSLRIEISEIARTPLLLGLLTQLWHREEFLPDNRFKAYDKLIDLLVVTHPIRRVTSARIDRVPPPTDLRRAFSVLALHVLSHHGAGIISRRDALRVLETHFADEQDGLALPLPEARRAAAEFLAYTTDTAALVVARSPIDVGFYHRALAEYLAAEALAAKDRTARLAFVVQHARDPEWHEVIAALAALTTAREDVKAVVGAIQQAQRSALDRTVTLPLLASIAFTASACPPQVAREIVGAVVEEIETGAYFPIRSRLLELVLRGLRAGPTQAIVRQRILRWLPRRAPYRRSIYTSLAKWTPHSDDVVVCLKRGLHEEDLGNARAAARAVVSLAKGDSALLTTLLSMARVSPLPRVRAVLLDAFLREGVALSEEQRCAMTGISPRGELQLVAIYGRVRSGEQTDADRESALGFASWGGGLDYEWRELLDELLVEGWGASDSLADLALRSLTGPGEDHIEPNIARRVLIRGFLHRSNVAEFIAAELGAPRPPHDSEIWPLFASFARECEPVKAAIDAWLPRAEHQQIEAHWGALTTRSDAAKQAMVAALRRSWPGWAAAALLEGWGMTDEGVAQALRDAIDTSPERACQLAQHLPEIIADQSECRARLLGLLPNAAHWMHLVVVALSRVRESEPEPEVVSAIIDAIDSQADDVFQARATLIASWSDDPRVEARAVSYASDPVGELAAVASAARRTAALRPLVLERLGVLPARLRLLLADRLEGWRRDPAAASALAAYQHEADNAVRTQCALTYYESETHPDPAAVDVLRAELNKGGVVMDAAREAAFAALLAVGRLDVFVDAKSFGSEPTPLRLRMHWVRGYNAPFWKQVAEHWPLLNAELGVDLFPRLTDSDSGSAETWDGLAIAAPYSASLAHDVVAHALQRDPGRLGANTLRVLARAQGNTKDLASILVQAMNAPARQMWWGPERYEDAAVVAAELLAECFGADVETLRSFAPAVPAEGAPAILPLVAICLGWPASEELESVFGYLRDKEVPIHPLGHGAVVATKSDAERVLRVLSDYDDYAARLRRPDLRVVTRLFVRRLREDDDVYERALLAGRNDRTADRAALLRIMTAARGLGEQRVEIDDLVCCELDGETAPIILRDPFTGASGTASSILLDGALAR